MILSAIGEQLQTVTISIRDCSDCDNRFEQVRSFVSGKIVSLQKKLPVQIMEQEGGQWW